MWFLRRNRTTEAREWWEAVAEDPHSPPAIVRELLRGTSVVCDEREALQALAWARAHETWSEEYPAFEVVDTITDVLVSKDLGPR